MKLRRVAGELSVLFSAVIIDALDISLVEWKCRRIYLNDCTEKICTAKTCTAQTCTAQMICKEGSFEKTRDADNV